ncbi:MAG: hypothetical protein FWC50_08260, partial [Planctomycetaceae bacterium]|nr:hypothetical protein [Planctomycetaceae bacterium]
MSCRNLHVTFCKFCFACFLFVMTTVFFEVHPLTAQDTKTRQDIVLADFEADNQAAGYGDWTVEGEAFGNMPAAGTLPNQMTVGGFEGKRLVNSYYSGDDTTGKLTSPEFKIERKYIVFLIGGGGYKDETCMRLLVDGCEVRQAAGDNVVPGGSEMLD